MRIERIHLRRVAPSVSACGLSAKQWRELLMSPATYQQAKVLKTDALTVRDRASPSGAATLAADAPASIASLNGWVGRVRAGQGEAVIKVRPLHKRFARLKVSIGLGRADRHWRAATLLAMKRIPTAQPYCLGIVWIDGVMCEVLAMRALDGPTLLECMAMSARGELDVRTQHALAAATARLTRDILVAGLFNRDHKPSNILVTSCTRTAAELALIDCVGVRRDWTQIDVYEEMCSKLLIEPIGCGVPVRRTLLMRAVTELCKGDSKLDRAKHREWIRAFWEFVEAIVQSHGDPRPKVNPLAPAATPVGAQP